MFVASIGDDKGNNCGFGGIRSSADASWGDFLASFAQETDGK